VGADSLVVASDEAAGDSLVRDIIGSCAHKGLSVEVKKIDEVAGDLVSSGDAAHKVILIVGDLNDAMRVYESGVKFDVLNIGNVHHDDGGRSLTPSVVLDTADDEIIGRFMDLGVSIDIRNVPSSYPCKYRARGDDDGGI
jgi:mannose/fructose/N-acetylgalactosamine-specific phosphotransferase system component IIB